MVPRETIETIVLITRKEICPAPYPKNEIKVVSMHIAHIPVMQDGGDAYAREMPAVCTSFRSDSLNSIRKHCWIKSHFFYSLPWSKFPIISLAVILVVAQRVGKSRVLVKVSA